MPYIDSGATITAGTNDTWVVWTQGTQTNATSAIANQIWAVWTGSGTAISATGSGTCGIATGATITGNGSIVWENWVEYADTAYARAAHVVRRAAYPTEVRAAPPRRTVSPEERAAYEARERALQAQVEAEREFRRIAEAKAEILLQRLLSPEQRETLKEKRCFYMYSNGKKYRIDRGQHGNVKLLDAKDQIVESYCIQPKGGIPDADAMAAQKLLLEADPETFVRVANITRRDGSYRQGTPLAAVG